MGALPRPDLDPGPARELNDALHELHHRAGWPSLRTLAHDAGCSHTTVSHVFSSAKLPSWGVVELLVEALGGRTAHVHDLWLAASSPSSHGAGPAPHIAGRRMELAAVRHHLESGSGLLLVTGEAGMGKTKLVTTAALMVGSDAVVATGHCLPLSSEVPLLPIADVLRAAYDVDGGDSLRATLSVCADYVPAALAPMLPELATDDRQGKGGGGLRAGRADDRRRQHLGRFGRLGRQPGGHAKSPHQGHSHWIHGRHPPPRNTIREDPIGSRAGENPANMRPGFSDGPGGTAVRTPVSTAVPSECRTAARRGRPGRGS